MRCCWWFSLEETLEGDCIASTFMFSWVTCYCNPLWHCHFNWSIRMGFVHHDNQYLYSDVILQYVLVETRVSFVTVNKHVWRHIVGGGAYAPPSHPKLQLKITIMKNNFTKIFPKFFDFRSFRCPTIFLNPKFFPLYSWSSLSESLLVLLLNLDWGHACHIISLKR